MPRSVLSFIVVVVTYWAYCLMIVPFIEPQIQPEQRADGSVIAMPTDEPLVSGGLNDAWRPLFEAGSWELQKSKVLETRQFTLLFKDYKTLDDGRIKLEPCTAIFHPQGISKKKTRRVFLLQAPEGALLEFDGPLAFRRARLGKLVRGQLMGAILIHSPESEPGAGDRLRMETQEVSLENDRIWTPHSVTFQYGNSFGTGRELNIQLQVDNADRDSDQPLSTVNSLRSLELVHVDRIHLEVAGNALPSRSGSSADSTDSPATATSSTEPSQVQVEVNCEGPFLIDFLDHSARFEQQVDVIHLRPDGESDQLNCQTLEIKLAPANSIHLDPSKSSVTSRQSHFSKLQPQSLIAWGHPATVRSPTVDFEAHAKRIVYDMVRRRIRLDGGKAISMRYGRHVMEAPETEYEMPVSEAVGRWWAAGPGTLRTLSGKDEIPQVSAKWQQEVRLRPQNEFHVLSLAGGATIALESMGQIRAEEIHCWMSRSGQGEQNEGPQLQGPANATGENRQPEKETISLAPERLMALHNVHIESPQLVGQTEHLEAWLIDRTQELNSDLPILPASRKEGTNEITKSALTKEVNHRSPTNPASERQLHLQGDKISLEIERGKGQPLMRDVTVEGHVHVAEVPSSNVVSPQPLSVKGNTLHIHNASLPNAEINVRGAPSEIDFGGLKLAGDHVQLQKQLNRLGIHGPGAMTVPLNRDLDGKPLQKAMDLNVTWQGHMNFDGAVIHFENAIHVQSHHRQIQSEEMDVHLSRRIDFQQNEPNQQVDIRSVEFIGQTRAENRTVEYGHLKSIDIIQADSLSIDQQSGKLLATGPGMIKSVRFGRRGGFGAPSGQGTVGRVDDVSLIFLKVEYRTTISGNIRDKELHFADNVRTIYGPIPDWSSELDPDSPQGLGREGVLLTCRRLSMYDMGQNSAGRRFIELFATGNTLVEGSTFSARANKITYTTEKDLLIMSGGRSDAELWHRPANSQTNVYVPAREIHYWPRTKRVKVISAGTPTIRGF